MASSSSNKFLKSREKFYFMSKGYVPSECGQYIEEIKFGPYKKIETQVEESAQNMYKQHGGDLNEWRNVMFDYAERELKKVIEQSNPNKTQQEATDETE